MLDIILFKQPIRPESVKAGMITEKLNVQKQPEYSKLDVNFVE